MTRPTANLGPVPITEDARPYWIKTEAVILKVHGDGTYLRATSGGYLVEPDTVEQWAQRVRGHHSPNWRTP